MHSWPSSFPQFPSLGNLLSGKHAYYLHDSKKDLEHSCGIWWRTRLISQVLHDAFAALVFIIYNSYNDAGEQIRLAWHGRPGIFWRLPEPLINSGVFKGEKASVCYCGAEVWSGWHSLLHQLPAGPNLRFWDDLQTREVNKLSQLSVIDKRARTLLPLVFFLLFSLFALGFQPLSPHICAFPPILRGGNLSLCVSLV